MQGLRSWFFAIFTIILVIGFGQVAINVWEFVYGDMSPLGKRGMTWLRSIDRWFVENGMFPSFIAIGVLGLLATYFAPRIWSHIRRYSLSLKQFETEFYDSQNVQHRESLRRHATQKYKDTNAKYGSAPPTLVALLREAGAPPSLPLDDTASLFEWASSTPQTFTGRQQELWDFVVHIYPRWESELDPQTKEIYAARNVTAKFWDYWGRSIQENKLKESDIVKFLKSNALDLRFLSYLEPAQVLQLEWDQGPGKSGLFEIASRAAKYIVEDE